MGASQFQIVTGESGAPPLYFAPADTNGNPIDCTGASCSLLIVYPQGGVGTALSVSPTISGYTDPATAFTYPAGTLVSLIPLATYFPLEGEYPATLVIDQGGGQVRKSFELTLNVGGVAKAPIDVTPGPAVGTVPVVTVLPSVSLATAGDLVLLDTMGTYALFAFNGDTTSWQAV